MTTTATPKTIVYENYQENNEVADMSPADQKLRIFFLEEARLLCPATRTNCSEYSKIHAVYKRLKRMERLFTLMYQHNWGALLPEAQKAINYYLLEGYAPKKERPHLIDLLTREMNFTVKMAQFNDFITVMMQHLILQVGEAERMMNTYYRPETRNPFPETDDGTEEEE